MANSTECEDCGIVFPLQQNPGRCIKCQKLEPFGRDSLEYADIFNSLQCAACGVTRRNMIPARANTVQTCGSVHCNEHMNANGNADLPTQHDVLTQAGTSNTLARSVPDAGIARAAATRDRLRLLPASFRAPTTTLNTATLVSYQTGGGAAGEPKVLICWQVRVSPGAKIDADLGCGSKPWAYSVSMTDVKADITAQISIEWTRRRSSPLLPEDVTLRFEGNKILDPNTATLSVKDFYEHYTSDENASNFIRKLPGAWKHLQKGNKPVLCLDIYIDRERWTARADSSGLASNSHSSLPKRALPDSTGTENENPLAKRIHTGGSLVMGSQFRISKRTERTAVITRTPVSLSKIICVITNNETAEYELETTRTTIYGDLRDLPMCSGSMKHIYDLKSPDGDFVVKRFFRLKDNEDEPDNLISIADNNIQIEAELGRLVVGQWFLSAFFKHARSCGVTVDEKIMFAEAFLGQEECDLPSPASGGGDAMTPKIQWLVEARRPTAVTRYSGTLVHPSVAKDLQSLTIFAFVHFAWGHSNKTLIFADIQGTATSVRGRDSLVLFDVMTHTVAGDSGIGDFGVEGINTFLQDHKCRQLCTKLGLHDSVPLRTQPTVDKAKSRRQRQSKKTPIVNEISDDSEPETTRRAEIRHGKRKAVTGHNSNPGPSATGDRESDRENGHYDDIDGSGEVL